MIEDGGVRTEEFMECLDTALMEGCYIQDEGQGKW